MNKPEDLDSNETWRRLISASESLAAAINEAAEGGAGARVMPNDMLRPLLEVYELARKDAVREAVEHVTQHFMERGR